MSKSPFLPSKLYFGINKIDRSDVLNCRSSSTSSSTAKVFTTTINTITKPGLFIPGKDSINQSAKTGTSLVGRKFKIKQWKITKARGTKFSDTDRCIKLRLRSLLQRGVNLEGNGSENEENLYINVLESTAAKLANKTALSCFLKMGVYTKRTLAHQQVHLELPFQQTNCNVCRSS